MRWRWTRARGEKKRPHVIQDHVRSFGACVIIAARRALWCLYFLGHLMARRIIYEKECIRCWVYGRDGSIRWVAISACSAVTQRAVTDQQHLIAIRDGLWQQHGLKFKCMEKWLMINCKMFKYFCVWWKIFSIKLEYLIRIKFCMNRHSQAKLKKLSLVYPVIAVFCLFFSENAKKDIKDKNKKYMLFDWSLT